METLERIVFIAALLAVGPVGLVILGHDPDKVFAVWCGMVGMMVAYETGFLP